eukprot:scaffold70768_cov38-Prasinocladus_malaysianus.AAC.1
MFLGPDRGARPQASASREALLRVEAGHAGGLQGAQAGREGPHPPCITHGVRGGQLPLRPPA